MRAAAIVSLLTAATDLGTTPAFMFTLGALKADAATAHSLTSLYRDCMSVHPVQMVEHTSLWPLPPV